MKKINDYKTLLSKMIESRNSLEKDIDKMKEGKDAFELARDTGYAFMLGQWSIIKNFIDICKIGE